jgi:hypothetical protein
LKRCTSAHMGFDRAISLSASRSAWFLPCTPRRAGAGQVMGMSV